MIALAGGPGDAVYWDCVPALALRRAKELRGTGITVVVLERRDDVIKDFLVVGRYGLRTYLDDHYQAPFEYVRYVREGGRKVFEALLLPLGKHLLIVPDEEWVDEQLLVVLDVEGEEALPPR